MEVYWEVSEKGQLMQILNLDPVGYAPEDDRHGACSSCGKPMAGQGNFCANCGHPRGAQVKIGTRHHSAIFLFAAAIALLVVIVGVIENSPDSKSTAPAKFDPGTLLPGATVQLRVDGGTAVPVVPTRDLYKEWMKLGQANDTLGEQMMTIEGQMLWTPNGTRARILESHDLWDGSYRVRILDGPLYGQAVWTNKGAVNEDKVDGKKSAEPSAEN